MYTAFACSRAFRSFLPTWDLRKPSAKNCRIKFIRIVRTVPSCMQCDEVAMYRGELPQFAILPRPAKLQLRLGQPLVKLDK